ncbi:MAG: hypothetical protein HY892_21975 [Deltaproteobacteria bacterium]|nr:hypothetical protein [Deltaproteobacteria bacterium]
MEKVHYHKIVDYRLRLLKVKEGGRGLLVLAAVSVLLAWFAAGSAVAQSQEPAAPPGEPATVRWGRPSPMAELGLGTYFSRGENSWQISFPTTAGTGRSALEFKDLDGVVPFASLTLRHPQSLVGINLLAGSGNLSGGRGTDSDYINGGLLLQSRMDVSGDLTFWSADLETTISGFWGRPWYLRPFLGWQQHEEKLRLTNGQWTTILGVPASQPILGLDSRYEFNWEAVRLGLQGGLDFITRPEPGLQQLGLKGSFAFFPYLYYRGEGRWNLRPDLKQDPSFVHEAEKTGWGGWDGLLGLYYRPWDFLEFEGGARASYFKITDGTDTIHLSDNSTLSTGLDRAESWRYGLYLKLTGRF